MDKTTKRDMVKNFSTLIIAQVIYKILAFVMIIAIARYLGTDKFGQFSYGLSLVWVFLFISDFGLSELFIRDVAYNKLLLDRYVSNIITLKILIGLLSYFAIFLLACFLSFTPDKFWIIILLGGAVILDSFMYFFRCIFRVRETFEYEAFLMIIEAILKLTIIMLAIKSGISLSAVILLSAAVLMVSVINLVISLIAFISSYRVPALAFDTKFMLQLLISAFPFTVVYVLSLINFRINIVMLSVMKGDIESGWYSANYKVVEQFLLIPITLSVISLPVFSKFSDSLHALKKFFMKSIPILLMLSIAILAFFYLFGNWVIKIIYGDNFSAASTYLRVLSWTLVPFFIKKPLEKLLLGLRKQTMVCLVYLAGVILNIILSFYLIPGMGVNGASLSTFLSESFVVLIFLLLFKNLAMNLKSQKLDVDKATVINEPAY